MTLVTTRSKAFIKSIVIISIVAVVVLASKGSVMKNNRSKANVNDNDPKSPLTMLREN